MSGGMGGKRKVKRSHTGISPSAHSDPVSSLGRANRRIYVRRPSLRGKDVSSAWRP